ncbi:hypothetical protein B0H66DRAFT_33821 [Apodospora peruviana]|uniref:Uncharacterized protein n=1 Tax=Apodospora peruviana TaxID=516989 RepID=A0AAE0IRE6_9PEZI|nr:hypothetical protein B0H66DRAFT_33821 [Apodospora peruviana]
MPSLWKSGSTSGRAKTGHRSIRGTISGPIPIPSSLDDDDEFPIRTPGAGAGTAAMKSDEEFPIRRPGTGIASPVPPDDVDTTPEEEQQGKSELASEQKLDEKEQEQVRPDPAEGPSSLSADVSGDGRTDPIRDVPPEAPLHPPPPPPSGSSISIGRPPSRTPPQRVSQQRSSRERISPSRLSPPRAKTSPQTRRITNPLPTTVRYSVVSDTPSKQTTQSKDAPQRKKSTLRTALGRLFGRSKRKNSSIVPGGAAVSASGRDFEPVDSSHHRSDPTALSRSKEMSPKRSASLPITELDRPLRSHSIGPDDIMAIESARNSLQAAEGAMATPGAGGRRRAATTASSRLFYQPRIRDLEWGGGLSPRPASTHGRGSRLVGPGELEDPSEIGRAITSDSGGGGGGGRRRSRSLSGLQDLSTGMRPGARRRSDEIRFWRESYDPGFMSPLSSNPQDDADVDDTGVMDISAPESPIVERPPKTPPQPFIFGPITNEMVGMKITQAASIDMRIGNLEGRTWKLERVVDQLCHAVPGFRAPLDDDSTIAARTEPTAQTTGYQPPFMHTSAVPPTIPAIYQTMPTAGAKASRRQSSSRQSVETDSHSRVSFGDAPAYVGSSLHPPSSSSATQSRSLTATAAPPGISVDRPMSESTLRGSASLPTMGRDVGAGEGPYAELVAQLETERAARLELEAQVKKLSERLNTLSTTMFAMVRDPTKSRSRERLTPSVGGSSPLLQPPPNKTLAVPPQQELLLSPGQQPVKALSVFDQTDEEDEGERPEKTTTGSQGGDELTEDDFQTPREERPPHSYGAFGEELVPDDDDDAVGEAGATNDGGDDTKRKKAARTLSLSQLTLGKGQHTQI